MPLYVKDPEIDTMVSDLAERRGLSKTEVVRQALRREVETAEQPSDMIENVVRYVDALHRKYDKSMGLPADKAFIDSLYEDD